MAPNRLTKLKRRLGITDKLEDDLLKDIISDAESHFKLITGAESVQEKYEFIIIDVADKRYSRKGAASMESETIDGYSARYRGIEDDFKPYIDLLKRDFGLDDFGRRGNVVWW